MNATVITPSFASTPSTKPPVVTSSAKRQQQNPHRLRLDKIPPDTRRRAAVVLEVMAGLRSCPQAAESLGLALPSYYMLERRALEGLVQGCMPVPKGRRLSHPNAHAVSWERQCKKLQQDVMRYQALVRAQQRSVGLTATPEPAKIKGKGKGKGKGVKRPMVRALRIAEQLHAATDILDSTSDALVATVAPLVAVA